MPYAERRGMLQGWNFNCTCSLCSASEKERADSDRRRHRLHAILTKLVAYKGKIERLSVMLDESLDMLKKENMWFLVGNYYAGFAWAYLEKGDLENARKFGLLADAMAEKYSQEEGVGQILVRFWQTLKEKTASEG